MGGPSGPYTQMERLTVYKEYADELIAKGKAYRCYCTKEELDAQRAALKAQRDPKAQFWHPGTCRKRTDAPAQPQRSCVCSCPRRGASGTSTRCSARS